MNTIFLKENLNGKFKWYLRLALLFSKRAIWILDKSMLDFEDFTNPPQPKTSLATENSKIERRNHTTTVNFSILSLLLFHITQKLLPKLERDNFAKFDADNARIENQLKLINSSGFSELFYLNNKTRPKNSILLNTERVLKSSFLSLERSFCANMI